MKMTIIYALLSVFFGVYGTTASASNTNQMSQNLETAIPQQKQIVIGNWDEFNSRKIDRLIQEAKQKPAHSLYAVLILTTQQLFWISKRQRLSIN